MDEVIGKIHQPFTLEEMPRDFIFTQAEKVLGYISDGSRLQGAGFVLGLSPWLTQTVKTLFAVC